MDTQKLTDWAQIVGIVAVVASLIFVGLQLEQNEDIAYMDYAESTLASGIERAALLSEHSDIWQRACLGEELSPDEQMIANAIFYRYVHTTFTSWLQAKTSEISKFGGRPVIDAFAANYHRYPGFRRMSQSYEDWRERGFRFGGPLAEQYVDEIQQRVAELEREEPDPDADVSWCGVIGY